MRHATRILALLIALGLAGPLDFGASRAWAQPAGRATFNPRGGPSPWDPPPTTQPGPDLGREIWAFDDYQPFIQRFGVAHEIGDGIGYSDSYTSLEFMTPIRGDLDWQILFADLRMIVRNDGTLGGNAGVVHRAYNLDWNRIFGLNTYLDQRGTERHQFLQWGLGVESLGPIFDFRANAYYPVGEERGEVANLFVDHILIINRDYVTMPGVDVEVAANAPRLFGVQAGVAAGAYHFDGRDNDNATGWKARAYARYNEWLSVDARVQEDDLFGRTLSVGVALRYRHRYLPPTPAADRSMDHMFYKRPDSNDWRDIAHRLSEPVERLQNIVLTRQPTVALDDMGNPLNFLHVVPGGAGTGSFEDPYGTLSAALADAAAGNSIIYTPFGGDFVENVTLVPGAQVLSNGPVQTVDTHLGPQRLPFSGTSPDLSNLPSITGDVDMADDSRFSGFEVIGQLTATGVADFTVDNSVVRNNAGDAVVLTGVDAAVLDNLRLRSMAGRGLLLDDSSAEVRDVQVLAATDDGVEIITAGTDRTVEITNLTLNADGQGVDVNVIGAGDLTLSLGGMNDIQSDDTAFDAELIGGSTGDLFLSLDNTQFDSATGAGISLDGSAGAGTLFVTSLLNNSVVDGALGGLIGDTVTFDADPTLAGIQQVQGGLTTIGDASSPLALTGDGIRLIDPTGDLSFTNLNVINANGTGLLIDTTGGATIFNFETLDGSLSTANRPAINFNTLTVNMNLTQVQSTNSTTNGVFFDAVSGAFRSDSTILNDSADTAIVIQNTPSPFTADFGDTTIESTISDAFADNVDTTMGNGANLTLQFDSLIITGP